jgi:hypothetical protein
MKKSEDDFTKWFREQFGKVPEDFPSLLEIEADLNTARKHWEHLMELRQAVVIITKQWQAARYAQNV